jgi:hypothetical protein
VRRPRGGRTRGAGPDRGDHPPVRRHRPGRHRASDTERQYRPGGHRLAGHRTRYRNDVVARRRRAGVGSSRPGRHAVRPSGRPAGGTDAARYASLVITLSALLVSGWFAASGAAAFAQLVRP